MEEREQRRRRRSRPRHTHTHVKKRTSSIYPLPKTRTAEFLEPLVHPPTHLIPHTFHLIGQKAWCSVARGRILTPPLARHLSYSFPPAANGESARIDAFPPPPSNGGGARSHAYSVSFFSPLPPSAGGSCCCFGGAAASSSAEEEEGENQ